MKSYLKLPLLLIAFTISYFVILFQPTENIEKPVPLPPPQNQVVNNLTPGLPLRLIIPTINVDAAFQQLDLTPTGEMGVPSNAIDVGWFRLGPHPGEVGSAVVAGHFDGTNGEAGVFSNLHKLKKGDMVFVKNNLGTTTAFIVRDSRTYKPGYAEEVFSQNDKPRLNLITCDGVWDNKKRSYSQRLVVFTEMTSLLQ